MRPLRDIRLSRLGVLTLSLVSAVATVIILAGAGHRSNIQIAAEAALRHPLTQVRELPAPAATAPAPTSPASADDAASGNSGDTGNTGNAGDTGNTGNAGDGGTATPAVPAAPSPAPATTAAPTSTTTATTATAPTDAGLPKVGHVFLLSLSTPSYAAAFAPQAPAPYLHGLARRGTVLSGYGSLGSGALADLLATVSGQPPNRDTRAGCPSYVAFPQTATLTTAGVAAGRGCIYPDAALTVADQVNSAGGSWGAYVADMGANPCAVPNTGSSLGDGVAGTEAGYDVAHNPFAFFGSLLDAGGCSEYDQDLTHLRAALRRPRTTPTFTFLSGDACVDGDPVRAPLAAGATTTATTDQSGTATTTTQTAATQIGTTQTTASTTTATAPAGTNTATGAPTPSAETTAPFGCPAGESSGIAAENTFLATWVPRILDSAAYRADGVLIIAFSGDGGSSRARTGALVLSRWTPRGHTIRQRYTPYSLLHSIEDMLALTPLAHAADAPAFAASVLR